ncbi:MAG: hypothetical protein HY332_03090 [Chloroflexi bacterium]|nr:hypothetical protein [Chloroflexota bacterium]
MIRLRTRAPSVALIALLVAVAFVLAGQGTALAVQGPTMTSAWVGEMPADLDSPVWERASSVYVPLTPQMVALPRLTKLSVSQVVARSVNDGRRIAIRLEWTDATRDARATRPDEFRDAAAVLFPVSTDVPGICMGAPGQLTNLWHWKADWQEDLDRGFQEVRDAYPNFYKDSYPFVTGQPPFRAPADFAAPDARPYFPGLAAGNPLSQPRTSPVEELLASGFGTAAHKQRQGVTGRGVWTETPRGGRWRIVFVRDLAASDSESVNLESRSEVPVAFAVWNGSNQEVGARKQLSGLITMRLRSSPAAARERLIETTLTQLNTPPTYLLLGFGMLIGVVALAGTWARRRARAAGQSSVDGSNAES